MPTKKVSSSKKSQKRGSKSHTMSKGKKSKKTPMKEGNAYCLRCKKQTKMLSMKTRTTKNGRTLMYGPGECGHEVFRLK
jgi:hypothetical protein